MSLLSLVPGVGTIVEKACDVILPNSLSFVGDLLGGVVDIQTGNPLGALGHGLEFLKDLRDLPQTTGTPPRATNSTARSGRQEPPPPVPRGEGTGDLDTKTIKELLSALLRLLDRTPTPSSARTPPGPAASSWRGTPNPAAPPREGSTTTGGAAPAPPDKPTSSSVPSPPASPSPTSAGSGAPAASDSPPAAPSPPASAQPAPPAAAGSTALSNFFALSDDDFMNALRNGKLPPEVANSQAGMLQVQTRMNHIIEMNQLMTSMMRAIHDMDMAVIQNIRV